MSKAIEAAEGHEYFSSKTYDHSVGLSCCFRQWRAEHSHCRFLHGYAIKVRFEFSTLTLDKHNWVMDFGALKPLKILLENWFDHKTLVAKDDPELGTLQTLEQRGLIQLTLVDDVGCEQFARMIFEGAKRLVQEYNQKNDTAIWLRSVEVSEHGGNSASYRVKP